MKTYVSIDKRSKKAQKKYYSSQRCTWGDLNPASRIMPNGKAYNRKKDKAAKYRKNGRECYDSPAVFPVNRMVTPDQIPG